MKVRNIGIVLLISALVLLMPVSPVLADQTTISGTITLTLPMRLEMKTEAAGTLSEASKTDTQEIAQRDEGFVQSQEKATRQGDSGEEHIIFRTTCPK